MLSDRAKALRPVIHAAFDAGGLDAICELFAKLEARIAELEKRLNMNNSRSKVHLLRELTSFSEEGHRWAEGLIAALLAMTQAADDDRWISKGLKSHPELAKSARKRGRAKQSKERNLLMRMSNKLDKVLRYAHDIDVPFDNNQAERDLRMIKVQ